MVLLDLFYFYGLKKDIEFSEEPSNEAKTHSNWSIVKKSLPKNYRFLDRKKSVKIE